MIRMAIKKTSLVLLLIGLITSCCGAESPQLGGKVIDFEPFSDSQNLHGLNLGGVTLTNPITGGVIIFAKNRLGAYYHSPINSILSIDEDAMTMNPTVGVFDWPMRYVGLWAGDEGGDIDSWELEIFDSPIDGNSLGIVSSGDWTGFPYRKLEIYAPNIRRFESRWTGTEVGIAYDDLEFCSVVPIEKVDDVNDGDCREPGDEITYTIYYDYPADSNFPDINDVNIIDYLPDEVDFNSASNNGVYDSNSHTVMWNIGTLEPNEYGFVVLVVDIINAEPGGNITNYCEIKSGSEVRDFAYEYTPICRRIIYVDADADGADDGTSWKNAYNYLQNALQDANVSAGFKEIRLAAGTYKPDCNAICPNGSGNRNATFRLINNVKIRGGYGGYEAAEPNIRNTNVFTTILSGDIGTVGVNPDNSYNVIRAENVNQSAVLDGLTITGGNSENGNGGGIYSLNSSPVITNCIFAVNVAFYYGGGIYNTGGEPKITNCVFSGNSSDYGGGAIANFNSKPYIGNCTFNGNYSYYGGGIYNNNGSISTIVNCILWGDTTYYGSEINNYNDSKSLVAHSNIQGGFSAAWNPDADTELQLNLNFETYSNSTRTTTDAKAGLVAELFDYNTANYAVFETNGKIGAEANFAQAFDVNSGATGDCVLIWPNTLNVDGALEEPLDISLVTMSASSFKRSWSFWVYPKNTTNGTFIRHQHWNADEYPHIWWEIRISDSRLQFHQNACAYDSNGLRMQTMALASEYLTIDAWNHIAVVIDRTTLNNSKIYVNGLEEQVSYLAYSSGDITIDMGDCSPIRFGKGSEEFDGRLDEIRLYSRALNAVEVSIIFESGNISADPCFVNVVNKNYRLLPNSPCIGTGNNTLVSSDYSDIDDNGDINEPVPLDLDGFPRFEDGDCSGISIVDMGAYEFLFLDINRDGAVNFGDFAAFALQWFQTDCGTCGGADLTCDNQVDFLDLHKFTEWWLAGM